MLLIFKLLMVVDSLNLLLVHKNCKKIVDKYLYIVYNVYINKDNNSYMEGYIMRKNAKVTNDKDVKPRKEKGDATKAKERFVGNGVGMTFTPPSKKTTK